MVFDFIGDCTHSTMMQKSDKLHGVLFSIESDVTHMYILSIKVQEDRHIEYRHQEYENLIDGKVLDVIHVPNYQMGPKTTNILLIFVANSQKKSESIRWSSNPLTSLILLDLKDGKILNKRDFFSFEEHKLSKSNKNYFLTGRVIENIDIFSLNAEIVDYKTVEEKNLLKRVNHCVISYNGKIIMIGGKKPEAGYPVPTSVSWDPKTRDLIELFELEEGMIDPLCHLMCGGEIIFTEPDSNKYVTKVNKMHTLSN